MDIVWLGDTRCHDRAVVGGKAAYLSQLAAAHRVPPGFCLTAGGGAEENAELATAYDELAARSATTMPPVAVRSSALDEDGVGASFAGQHETYLNVMGLAAVAAAVQRCRASAFAPRALVYREAQGLAAVADTAVVVLVQQLVVADVSAVAFSANPVTGDGDELVVTASWGLGESIVGGTVTPDTYHLRKRDLGITTQQIADKTRMTVAVPGGAREVGVPQLLRRQPALTAEQVAAIGQLVLALEDRFGWPVDVECAFARNALYLLQCRPITTL
jgi:phosphoenolpyruvate synthase/pyruvate phosphate dikinase